MVTYYLWRSIVIRGEVEDTRLEAKAKDTKKFRGQGQGQTLSRPRPRKDKDTGASVLQKKIFAKFLAFFNKIPTAQEIVLSSSRNSVVLYPFLRKELCCPGAMTRRWAPPTRYTLRRNPASIMKDLI